MSAPRDDPFTENGTADDTAEFSLRPLRILKRQEPPQQTSRPTLTSEEFVCRPMRLGLSTTPVSRRRLDMRERKTSTTSPSSSQDTPQTPTSLPQAHKAHLPIQIKNLPIVQSPRRRLQADLSKLDDMIFAVCLVDFHHVRGPEVQWWRSNYHAQNDKLFRNLPFQALPDGSHLFEETFSNFNLVYDFKNDVSLDDLHDTELFRGNPNHLETLFGCSCVRQVKTADLAEEELVRNKDITRSMVQKAVVVITRKQPVFTKIKEKLSIITHSYFQQTNFVNFDLLESLFDNLNDSFKLHDEQAPKKSPDPQDVMQVQNNEKQEEFFVNLNLREILAEFKNDMLVILKALLLEKRVLIYSNNNLELLTQFQNNLIALIPDLLNNLELSGSPLSDYTEKYSPLQKPSSLKTNDRSSLLRFFGLPLQVFNTKSSFWNPYLPLQQLDELSAQSFMVGCSNLLIANQLTQFKIDVLVNLDTRSVTYPMGRPNDLHLSTADKKFVTLLLSTNRTKESYVGSDDYIRYQFEDYIRGLLATTRFSQYTERFRVPPPGFDTQADKNIGNLHNFNEHFVEAWFETKNYRIWNSLCDEFIFNFHDPVHIACAMSKSSPTKLSGMFSSFKKMPQPTLSLAERANQYFSHAQKPQKYLQEENSDKQQHSEETPTKPADAKSGWWGFS